MFALRELHTFLRCAVAQLRNGTESLAHGPANCGIRLDARPRAAFVLVAPFRDDFRCLPRGKSQRLRGVIAYAKIDAGEQDFFPVSILRELSK